MGGNDGLPVGKLEGFAVVVVIDGLKVGR